MTSSNKGRYYTTVGKSPPRDSRNSHGIRFQTGAAAARAVTDGEDMIMADSAIAITSRLGQRNPSPGLSDWCQVGLYKYKPWFHAWISSFYREIYYKYPYPYDSRHSTGHDRYVLSNAGPSSFPLEAPTGRVFTRRTDSLRPSSSRAKPSRACTSLPWVTD